MKKLSVFTNFQTVNGPFGGANSFMRTLINELEKRGFRFSSKLGRGHDVAFINALSNGIVKDDIIRIKTKHRLPIIHRKVGYTVSGGPEMRETVEGVPRGERLQLEFDPYVDFTVFQSQWSYDEFLRAGFTGKSTIIRNAVNSAIFSPYEKSGHFFWKKRELRGSWKAGERFRVAISSWSTDPNKGFSDYGRLDRDLSDHPEYEVWFFGRTPPGVCFENIQVKGALSHPKLAQELRKCHAMLTLSRNETCSNSLIEGLSCGLPAIYLDSGSNRELAGDFGLEFKGDFMGAFEELKTRYSKDYEKLLMQPFQIGPIADQYESVLMKVATK